MVKEGAEDAAARIIHQDRRRAERLGRPRYEVACRLLVGEIAPEGRARLACRFARRILVERSEEHTSELQSLMRISYAVFCLKKKKQKQRTQHRIIPSRTNPHLYQ